MEPNVAGGNANGVQAPARAAALSIRTLKKSDETSRASMDPRLQRLVAGGRAGVRRKSTTTTSSDEVAVIARVRSLDAWNAMTDVRLGALLVPPAQNEDAIVTGRVPLRRIERVREAVLSLKAAQDVRPTLGKTIEEIGARANLLPAGHRASGGRGVVIGIVDFGCDFAHRNFRHANGNTRLLGIWHQAGPSSPSSPFGYGHVYTRQEIDAALATSNPYASLAYPIPTDFELGTHGTHGTHVMDIAAGNGRGSGTPGVAPEADILFVDVAANDVPWSGPDVVGRNFGDSVQLLEAIRFIFDQAGNRPCVINVSLGTNGGPHDGSTLVEQGIDRMIRQAPNRAVVIAASNSYDDGIHAAGSVAHGGQFELAWRINSSDWTANELEIWYPGADRLTVELLAPDGASIVRIPPGQNAQLHDEQGRRVLFAANRIDDPNNHDNMINIYLEAGVPGGRWIVRLFGDQVSVGGLHAWIERDDQAQSSFDPPHDNSHTIGSISCGHETIVVGSYDAHRADLPLSYFSSAGPTRDGRQKPEISAPGHEVWAAHSRTGSGVIRKSGTSMAAPAVTGAIALLFAEAAAAGRSLTHAEIRALVASSARRNPPVGGAWDDRYGLGRISASGMLQAIMGTGPGASAGVSDPLPAVNVPGAPKIKFKPIARKPRKS